MDKVYLGDSVYVTYDGFHVVLTTENGSGPSNEILLDDFVVRNLQSYLHRLEVSLSSKAGSER